MKTRTTSLVRNAGGMFMALALAGLVGAAESDRPAAPPPTAPGMEGVRREPGPEARPMRRDAGEIEERLRLMDAEIKELRRLGDNESAARLERQRNQLKERLLNDREPRDGLNPAAPGEAGARPGADMARRQRLIRSAVENLQAAGLPELAEQVAREARNQMGNPANERGGLRPMGGRPQGEAVLRAGGTDQERVERMEMMMREMQQVMREMERRLRTLER